MSHSAPLVAVLLLLASVVAAAPAGAAADVTITIVVTDADEEPVRDVAVTVSYDGDEQTRTTLSNGAVLFDVPEGSTVEIDIEHDDYVVNAPVTVDDVDSGTEVPVTVYRKATAIITVLDEGAPVEDAAVTLTKVGTDAVAAEGTTDGNGVFESRTIEAGSYEVAVEKSGYYDKTRTTNLLARSPRDVTVEQGRVVADFRVVDENFEEPQPVQATVTIYDGDEREASLTTGEAGTVGLRLAVNTQYTVEIEGDEYETVQRTFQLGEEEVELTYAIDRTPTLTVVPDNDRVVIGQTVRVTVIDEYDRPVEGATLTVEGEEAATSDANGQAVVEIGSSGDLAIVAAHDGIESDATSVEGVDPDEIGEEDELFDEDDGDDDGSIPIPGFTALALLAALAVLAGAGLRRA